MMMPKDYRSRLSNLKLAQIDLGEIRDRQFKVGLGSPRTGEIAYLRLENGKSQGDED
jgi:hypothetical protein